MFNPSFGWIEESVDKKHLHSQVYSWYGIFPFISISVEKINTLDSNFINWYNQGNKNACVGASTAQLMAQINLKQIGPVHYDWWKHYCKACEIDGAKETTCAKDVGTYEWAGLDVLRNFGAYVFEKNWDTVHGIDRYFWVKNADEGRTVIAEDQLIGIGAPWFAGFMPEKLVNRNGKYWLPARSKWGKVLGGHAFGIYDALDSIQGFGFANTWGNNYPSKVYMSYSDFEYLLSLKAECAALVDKDFEPPVPPTPNEEYAFTLTIDDVEYTGTAKRSQ
jgi:hypothetical protein